MWNVTVWICGILGATVLYGAVVVTAWSGAVRVLRWRRSQSETGAGPTSLAERRARSWDEVPAWLLRDRPWAIALVLLGAPAIRSRTERYVDFRRRKVDWEGLLSESERWPRNEHLLVSIAYDLAGRPKQERPSSALRAAAPPGKVTLDDVINELDERDAVRVGVALDVRRGWVAPREALSRLART